MNLMRSFRVGMTAGILMIAASGSSLGASSSTVTLETGYSDAGQPVAGVAGLPAGLTAAPATGAPLVGNAAETTRIQPADLYAASGAGAPEAALLAPGTLVVAPGSAGAPRATAQGPAVIPDLTTPSLLFPALMALVAMAPLLGWLIISRRGRPRTVRQSHRALAQALAASVGGEEPAASPSSRPGRQRAATPFQRPRAAAEAAGSRDAARRELEVALRRGLDPAPPADADELVRLRSEVLDGLREMKARVTEFTEALESGQAELQTELGRAHRAVGLLRSERENLERSVRLSGRRPLEELAEPGFEEPLLSAAPVTFRPPRLEAVPPAEPRELTLDPAWLLLDDEDDGVWSPEPETAGRRPTPAQALSGTTAVRELARRSAPIPSAGDDPRERRRRIVEMARTGRTIDDISRELRVGRGEVTLALSRVR